MVLSIFTSVQNVKLIFVFTSDYWPKCMVRVAQHSMVGKNPIRC